MSTFFTTGLARAAFKAARPARRHVVRALRHHAARARALASRVLDAHPVDSLHAWFQAFFAVLRSRSGARHFSLRTLLYRPATPLRALAARRTANAPQTRRPRRMAATSASWFVCALGRR